MPQFSITGLCAFFYFLFCIAYCIDTGPAGNRSECHPLSRSFDADKKDDLEFYVYK